MFFSRSRYIASWASSQGLSYSGDYDYKFAKKHLYFDAISRGQKSYAFNVMKGTVDYTNKSASDAEERTTVKAFDFCYTEVKTIQQNKRIQRFEKTQEFSALVFDADGYSFKSMIVTPRDMQLDSDISEVPVQQADPDVDGLLKGPQKDKDDDDKDKDDGAAADKNETDAPKVAAEP